jgi:hypothetical protein
VGEGPWLRVAFAGDGFAPALQAQVAEQLAANLRAHHVVLCDAASERPGAPPALGAVDLSLSLARVLSLEVSDAVTDKRLARQVPLGGVPRDALALSIALAAEELLHASWIEAALAPPEAPSPPVALPPVPEAVREVNQEELARIARSDGSARTRPPWVQMALVAAADRWTGGQSELGGDVRAATGGRFAVEGLLGLRAAADVSSVHGTIRSNAFVAGAGANVALVPRQAPWGLQVGARAEVFDVEFSAIASPGARASSGSQLGAAVSGSLGAWWRLGGPWRLLLEGTAGGALRAVIASDAGNGATGVSGALFAATLGVGAVLSE